MSNVTLMKSLLGRPQEALEDARPAIARLHALGDDVGASHLYYSEMIALLTLESESARRRRWAQRISAAVARR